MKFHKIFIMKILLVLPFFLTACYTKTSKPDYNFMNSIKLQDALDSNKRTAIEINPKKYYFGIRKNNEKLKGFFYIRNTGDFKFNILALRADCVCIKINKSLNYIKPGDSLKVIYEVDFTNMLGATSHSIVAIGNCAFGNQTFYMEGTIIKQ